MRRVPRVVARGVGRGRALRLARLGGRHVRHPVGLDVAHAASGRQGTGGQDDLRCAALHVGGLLGRAYGERSAHEAARPALQRHRGVQLSGE